MSLGLVDIPLLIDPETSETQPFVHLWGQALDPTVWGGAHIEVLVIESDLESIIFDTGAGDNTGIENIDILEADELDWSNATTHDVVILEITEEGLILPLENPIPEGKEPSLFFSFSLPAGHTRLQVTSVDGSIIKADYSSMTGDVISAMYFSL